MMRGAGGRNKEFQKPPSERQKKVRQQKRHLSAVKGRAFIQDVVNGQEKAGFSNHTVNERGKARLFRKVQLHMGGKSKSVPDRRPG